MMQLPKESWFFVYDKRRLSNGHRTYVERLVNTSSLPWVYVTRSTVCDGEGVFAARPFKKGESLGKYTGFVLGFCSIESDVCKINSLLENEKNNSIIELSCGEHELFVDGKRDPWIDCEYKAITQDMYPCSENTWPGMFAHVVNSCEVGEGRYSFQNVHIQRDGTLKACLDINVGEELLTKYGKQYWESSLHSI
jgi:hypothetical protein